MNIRLITCLTTFIMLLPAAQAADRAAIMAASSERAALLQAAGRGATISSNNQQYQILSGVRASESKAKEQPQQTLSRMGGGKLVETKGGFVVFTELPQSAASVMSVNGTSYPTVINPRTGGIGIVPGTLSVKLKKNETANAVATDHGLDVVRVFAHLQTVFYRVKPGQDVVVAVAALSADARVESAEVEVIEHVNMPH